MVFRKRPPLAGFSRQLRGEVDAGALGTVMITVDIQSQIYSLKFIMRQLRDLVEYR